MASFIDSVLTVMIPLVIVIFIGSKIYNHEEKSLKPIVEKVKSWFEPKEDTGSNTFEASGPMQLGNFEIEYGAKY